jgi:hypothetical protein
MRFFYKKPENQWGRKQVRILDDTSLRSMGVATASHTDILLPGPEASHRSLIDKA